MRRVGAGLVLVALLMLIGASSATASGCDAGGSISGSCIGGGTVNIGGSAEVPGSGGSGGGADGGEAWQPNPDWATGGDGTPGSNIGPGGETAVCSLFRPGDCVIVVPPPLEGAGAAPVQPVTIHDVASFAPDAPTVTTEPGEWGLLKRYTNVIAGASGHVRTGTLLGQPVEVNFIPVGFSFDYGDGTTASSATGGASWAALGLAEFSKTPTGHRYTEPGEKSITVVVTYQAEYRLAGGAWQPVVGTLDVPSTSPHTIHVLRNTTVGVDKPCTAGRKAVGC